MDTTPPHPTARAGSEQPTKEIAAKKAKATRLLGMKKLLQAHGENNAQDERANGGTDGTNANGTK